MLRQKDFSQSAAAAAAHNSLPKGQTGRPVRCSLRAGSIVSLFVETVLFISRLFVLFLSTLAFKPNADWRHESFKGLLAQVNRYSQIHRYAGRNPITAFCNVQISDRC